MRRDRYEERKKKLMSLFIAAIMIFSVAGFGLSYVSGSADSAVFEYAGLDFVQEGGLYKARVDGVDRYFTFLPSQVDSLDSQDSAAFLRGVRSLQVTYDPRSDMAESFGLFQYSARTELADETGVYVSGGLTDPAGFALPRVSCAQATESSPVIELISGNLTYIQVEGNCVRAYVSSDLETARLYDWLRYSLFEVLT